MQRLQFDPEEKITRKEYLKRKKKEAKKLRKRSKLTYVMMVVIAFLSIYVFVQLYIYRKNNNFKYVSVDAVDNQKVYNVYYVTEGYTYDPVYTLKNIHSNGFDDEIVYQNSGMYSIEVSEKEIFGIKDKGLYKIDKVSNEQKMLIEKDVLKYKLKGNIIYYITEANKLRSFNLETNENKEYNISNVCELIIDDNYIFTVEYKSTTKRLVRYNLDGSNKKEFSDKINVSYIISENNLLYFVNKNDGNKIYSIDKEGKNLKKISDIVSVADKGKIDEVDGYKYMFVKENILYYINVNDNNSLWGYNLETNENLQVIASSVEILQQVEDTIFYKNKNEMGVYLYNFKTKFHSEVTKRKIKEFSVDKYTEVVSSQEDKKI